jgi:hypothetical protein
MRPIPAVLAAAALLAGCGQPLLSAQLEVPEIRITQAAKRFPAAAPALSDLCDGATFGCVKTDLAYDLGAEVPVFDEPGIDFDLRLTDVALHLVADPDPLSTATTPADLSGVEAVRVMIRPPGSTGAWTIVAAYARPPGATPTAIAVSGNSNIDLGPYVAAGKLDARVEVSYDLAVPPPDFFADVEAAFSLVVTLKYDAYL